jgi:NitT/TauT family transport system ATP-binding protein
MHVGVDIMTIEAINVTKSFKIRNSETSNKGEAPESKFYALDGVNLNIKAGEFFVIIGPSGCGKSSFLDLIGGLTEPDNGEILINGKPITGPGLDRAIVFQQSALFPWRTALDNVSFLLEAKKVEKSVREKIARKYLSLVGLSGFEDRYPYELSGGMKQRVAIARALAINPEVLLMDEPFAALDAQTREIMQRDLLKIRDQTRKTVIFITHSIDEAVFLADRVAVMTGRPGIIKNVIDIPIPRSSRLSNDLKITPEFVEIRHKLWELLTEEVFKTQEIHSKCSIEECSFGDVRSVKKVAGFSIPLEIKSK